MNQQIPNTEKQHGFIHAITRRGLMGKLIGMIAALMGMVLIYPLASYTIRPALKKRPKEWIDILDPSQLKPHEPKSAEVVMSLKDGWLKSTTVKSVWLVQKNPDEIVIYSPLCTHLGCGYRWENDQKVFMCPCHGSVFSIDGQVLAGPAPRPLDTLPVKIENGRIWTIYKEFKAGTSQKLEL
jgi:menaquinol-cytochrome c reductase iron-sulfur subunit